jgi:hypothetical protein
VLNLLKHNPNSRKIIKDGYSLLLVTHVNELKQESMEYLDGFVIDTDRMSHAKEILLYIRTQSDVQKSLLPVFINSIYKLPQEVAIHADGEIELSQLASYMQRVVTIAKRIQKIETPKLVAHDVLIQFKTLAYSYTRNVSIMPKPSSSSSFSVSQSKHKAFIPAF